LEDKTTILQDFPKKTADVGIPEPANMNDSLQLNPEDFMVKIRPKRIGDIPKDAKSKLKTSAFGIVQNTPTIKESGGVSELQITKTPSSPSELLEKDKDLSSTQSTNQFDLIKSTEIVEKVVPEIPIKEIEPDQPSEMLDKKQIENIKKTLIDLKLKKADLYKRTLEYDMKELNGEISSEELIEKKSKISEYEKKMDDQIQRLKKLLED
jgi:hypothetical protein